MSAASVKQLPVQRPAETGAGLAAALVVIIAAAFDVDDPAVLSALTIVVGAVPALVTWLVELRRKQ